MIKKVVVLIHGLLTNSFVMRYIEKKFTDSGYEVYNFNYNSIRYSDRTLNELDKLIRSINDRHIYLVCHSMGGLVARNYLHSFQHHNHEQSMIKGVVTIATPHYQSVCAHAVVKTKFRRYLGTSVNSGLTKNLPEWESKIPLGCIAGLSKSVLSANLFMLLVDKKGDSDGTVLLEEAILKNCHDSIIIKGSHTGLLFKKEVAQQCINFVEHIQFNK